MKKMKLKVNEFNSEEVEKISKRFNISKTSSKILLNRGIKSFIDIEQFLNPSFEYFEKPDKYKDLDKGCQRLVEAIKNNERILIYGDYDVDGVASISQFLLFLREAGADVSYYVPERESEGYGISTEFVQGIKDGQIDVDLLITVDCGISEIEKIHEISSLGKDVIIIDHHQCKEDLPQAYAIVNPKQKDCPSENKDLCAAGLTYKFLLHLNTFLNISNIEDILLEYACLATVADIVTLLKDNRIIVWNGLKKINDTQILGLKKLIEVAGIKDKTIRAHHIGFIIAPRINAAGRMDSAKIAVDLMLTKDEEEAEKLASEIDRMNVDRKEAENAIFEEAVEKIESDFLYKRNIIVVSGSDWHEGVIGIVASKLTEKYNKPSIVISVKDGIGKGSARSMEYLDIFDSLEYMDSHLDRYGGHKLAAGLTIMEKNINSFADELNSYISSIIDEESSYREVKVDSILEISDVNLKFFDEISKFEPFGSGNPKPLMALRDVSMKNIRKVGKDGRHISFILSKDDWNVPVIGFGKVSILEKILSRPYSYVVYLNENIFRGRRSIQLILQDVEEGESLDYQVDEEKMKKLRFLINKTKSKIMKTDIFRLVEKLNTLYNTKITAEEVVCMLRTAEDIQYAFKNDILYIKK